nr:reverse transcriptase domain-containing protein [Tanacetum cinerariifolium]GEZ88075.1 reverse transcriptase domain-containing protein [Tanacetum cinerariifolium]
MASKADIVASKDRKARGKEDLSNPIHGAQNDKIPSGWRNSHIAKQQDHPARMLNGFTTRSCLPIRQKKWGPTHERNKAISEEVKKLVEADIRKEVHYHSWLSNPVMVKKHDDSWRMCVDFKDLNKACPKDGYPLLKIDWKVESLCGYPYKCFLDAYKGYHQIKMAKEDEEKTAFITSQAVFCYSKCMLCLFTIYKNAKLKTQLFKKVSDQKDNTHDTSENTKLAKQPIMENLPKVGETNALSKLVTSNSVSTPQESKGVNNDKTTLRPEDHSLGAIQSMTGSPLRLRVVEDVISKVVCAMCKQCLISVSHDVCLCNYVNGKKSRDKKQMAKISVKENQKKYQPKVTNPKKVGIFERLATPKPRKPRFLLRWSPTDRLFDQEGKLVASSESESQSDCSNGDNA